MKLKWLDRLLIPLALVTIVAWIGTGARIVDAYAKTPPENSIELPILMYHHLTKGSSPTGPFTITVDAFRADLNWIFSQGYTPILVRDLIDYTENGTPLPPRPIMITFDDGYESFYAYAYPILQELNCKAEFAIVGQYVDQYTEQEDHHVTYSHSNWAQLREMQESGLVEIQNHSYNLHINNGGRQGSKKLPGEDPKAYRSMLTSDLGKLQEKCLEQIGVAPNAFVFPFGHISSEAFDVAKSLGMKAALTCEEKINYLTGNPEELYRLRRFNRPTGTSAEAILRRAGATLSPLAS